MITKLVMKCFKKHADRTIDFGAGLTALLGANEAGKSTVYYAITYALGGARSLPEALDDFVTYGNPVSALKVSLTFTHEGQEVHIDRSKSGAKLTHGTVTANGQTEVTKYVEKLLGASMDLASKLMVASQGKLRGALESGDAVSMIEKLANISLIDELIGKIQETLPCGNTKAIATAIAELSEVAAPVLDKSTLEASRQDAADEVLLKQIEVAQADDALKDLDLPTVQNTLAELTRNEQAKAKLVADIGFLEAKMGVQPEWPEHEPVEALEQAAAQQKIAADRWSKYQTFLGIKAPEDTLEMAPPVALEGINSEIAEVETHLSDLKVQSAVTRGQLITDLVCKMCGKPRDDHEQIAATNLRLEGELEGLSKKLANYTQELITLNVLKSKVQKAVQYEQQIAIKAAALGDCVQFAHTFPATLEWVGEVPAQPEAVDYTWLLKHARAIIAQKLEHATQMSKLSAALAVKRKDLSELPVIGQDRATLEATIQAGESATAKLVQAKAALKVAEAAQRQVEMEAALALQAFDLQTEQYQASLASKAKLEEQLEVMQRNNALIKKLREARPIVAARLWGVVLASVSTYFSQIRGERSVVTRAEDGFKVNGKPATGLSGSTLDSLGLAIRMALGRTFLPSVDFLLLDEPSAGMDENRETAMLGLLATVNYQQVVLVTHSRLADSFANQVIAL